MKKLRIAVLASNFIRIPPTPEYVPQGYSGAPEMIAYRITEELVKRGHDVTLFASSDSKTSAKLASLGLRASATNPDIGIGKHSSFEYILISKAYAMANEGKFDIIHSQFDIKSAHFAALCKTPTVSTLHNPLALIKNRLRFYKKTQFYVSISNAQRKPIPDLKYAGTVYHGIDYSKIKFSPTHSNYLAFVGRITLEKGVHLAIDAARKSKNKLFIIGDFPRSEIDYYKTKIEPFIDGKKIIKTGFIDQKKVFDIMGGAKAILMPVLVEESFGLAIAEAMGAGTPTIGFRRGSIPEIIDNGKNGFVVKNVSEMVKKISEINKIDRGYCRRYAESKFNIDTMMDNYEKVYKKVINLSRSRK